ncbi:MAG: class I SAM-dependent methyltransferase [Myxococcales bacterium]|nr:class I SAM-dependent methyltransferase [Myxococcales bacterium]
MRFTPGWLRDPLLDDATFDGRMPDLLRLASRLFWTPVAVARRMGSLFALHGAQRVLDVGSGPGKACLVAAAAAPAIRFVGVEQRSGLVAIAQGLAASAALGNVEFRCADATRTSLDSFDGAYLFNPFAENLFSEAKRFDHSVELSERRAIGDLLQMEGSLARARPAWLSPTTASGAASATTTTQSTLRPRAPTFCASGARPIALQGAVDTSSRWRNGSSPRW